MRRDPAGSLPFLALRAGGGPCRRGCCTARPGARRIDRPGQAYLDAERCRHPVPRLTSRQNELLRLLAAGHTNTQIARRLGISEGTVRTYLENIYEKLGVSSRTAAVTRALPDRIAQDPPGGARPANQVAVVTPA
jgi:DNA-binding CsgD family transcriptional regulator